MLAAIMTEPDFAEVMFLVALIVFLVGAFVAWVVEPRNLWALVISIGLAVAVAGVACPVSTRAIAIIALVIVTVLVLVLLL